MTQTGIHAVYTIRWCEGLLLCSSRFIQMSLSCAAAGSAEVYAAGGVDTPRGTVKRACLRTTPRKELDKRGASVVETSEPHMNTRREPWRYISSTIYCNISDNYSCRTYRLHPKMVLPLTCSKRQLRLQIDKGAYFCLTVVLTSLALHVVLYVGELAQDGET